MSLTKVNVNELSYAVMAALAEYGQIVSDDVKDAVKVTTSDCLKDIKANAKAYGWKKYPDTWTSKIEPIRTGGFTGICYARNGGYQIAHLLENKHALRGGGTSTAYPHIRPAEEAAEGRLLKLIRQKIGG